MRDPVLEKLPRAHLVRLAWLLAFALAAAAPARAQTIPGLDAWADATAQMSMSKWKGPRVPFPSPRPRPTSTGRLDSLWFPLSVHVGQGVTEARGLAVLAALERAYPVLLSAGWIPSFGDAGLGGSPGHDVYLLAVAEHGASAAVDASEPYGSYDAARAFALLDARVPSSHVEVCATEALLQALLLELDPAEAESVRRASASYVAWLATGVPGCGDDLERALEAPWADPFANPESAGGALWLARLSAREDRQSGTFLRAMWEFARQHTWEGRDLRASPDLLECIAQALELRHVVFEESVAALAEQQFLAAPLLGVWPERPEVVRWDELPEHLWQPQPIEQLGARYAWVALEQPRPGEQLRVWSRGEYGARWALLVTRLDAAGKSRGSMRAPVRNNPHAFLVVELDAQTTDVLITLANAADGVPDPDPGGSRFAHGAELIVARGNPGGTMPGTTDDPP